MTATPKYWHAVYTKSRAEKKVQLELEYQGIEHYLPIQKQLRQWSDRKKWVDTILISGYIFVRISKFEHDKVLRTPGVVSYVRTEGTAAIIPDEQIESIRRLMQQSEFQVKLATENFSQGDRIEIIGGPLIGVQGQLVSIKGKKKVCIQLEQLHVSLVIETSITEIRKILDTA